MKRVDPLAQLAAPAAARRRASRSSGRSRRARSRSTSSTAIVSVAIVVAIYVFVGNSGVLSFGQISFVAVGAFARGVLTVPLESKHGVLPDLYPLLRDHTIGNLPSLVLATVVGRRVRVSRRDPADAPLGARGRHRDVRGARDHAQPPARVDEDRARRDDAVARPRDDRSDAGRDRRRCRDRRRVRVPAQPLRALASRDARGCGCGAAAGIDVHRQRLWAFTLSGALAGLAGGLYVHLLGSITADQVYLELTFVTLAMLVIGGITSLWGAVVGALAVSGLDSFLSEAEQGVGVGFTIDLPQGAPPRRARVADGARARAASVGYHRRTRVRSALGRAELQDALGRSGMRICVVGCGAVGSLFAANLATLDDVEVWAFDLNKSHVDAIKQNGLQLSARARSSGTHRRRATPPRSPPATSASSRRRRCTPTRRSRRPRTRSPTARSRA